MTEGIGVFRDQDSMERAEAAVRRSRSQFDKVSVQDKGKTFNTDLMFALELDYMIDLRCGRLRRRPRPKREPGRALPN